MYIGDIIGSATIIIIISHVYYQTQTWYKYNCLTRTEIMINPVSIFPPAVCAIQIFKRFGLQHDIHINIILNYIAATFIDSFRFRCLWIFRYPKVHPRLGCRMVPPPDRRAVTWTTTVPPSAWTARVAVTVLRRPAAAEVPATVQPPNRDASRSPPKYCSVRWTPYRRWSRTTSCTGRNRNDHRPNRYSNDDDDPRTVRRRFGPINRGVTTAARDAVSGGGASARFDIFHLSILNKIQSFSKYNLFEQLNIL